MNTNASTRWLASDKILLSFALIVVGLCGFAGVSTAAAAVDNANLCFREYATFMTASPWFGGVVARFS